MGHTHPRLGFASTSTNWAGYDVIGGPFSSVSATWTQPPVAPSGSADTYSAFWVGIDGDDSPTVEQIGTEGNSVGGIVTYDAWYEMYPRAPRVIPVPVRPGDSVTGSVTASGHTFTLTLVNDSTGASFTTTETLPAAQLASAEVIAEAPYLDGVLPLADFGMVTFSDCAFDGRPIASFAVNRIDMLGDSGVARTSDLGADGVSFFVSTDVTPPTTTVQSADAAWHRRPVTLRLAASDNPGGTSVDYTEYSLDGGATWTRGTTVTVVAPADHSNDGLRRVLYRSVDKAGNVETTRGRTVRIDTRRPRTAALRAVTVRRGGDARLAYKVLDALPDGGTARVVIRVRNTAGRLMKTLTYAAKPVNEALVARLVVPRAWRPGAYRFFVYATDKAGNPQTKVASNRLVVK